MTMTPPSPEATRQPEGGAAVRVQRLVGRHCVATLILGDSEAMELPDADAIVTDPPYGAGYASKPMPVIMKHSRQRVEHHAAQTWDEETAAGIPALATAAKWVAIWGGNYYTLPPSRCWLARYKPDAAPSMADMELAWTNQDANAKLLTYTVAAMRESGEGKHHPTQKPVRVMAWTLERLGVPKGATVLDPYMGSGSTGIACIRLGMNFIGIERDAAHYKTACDRIAHELDGALL